MYPVSGMESVACGLTMTYKILNTGDGHWVTVSGVGVSHPDVFVYDSMYSTAGTTLEAQIASLRCTQESVLKIKFVDVQRQSGTF